MDHQFITDISPAQKRWNRRLNAMVGVRARVAEPLIVTGALTACAAALAGACWVLSITDPDPVQRAAQFVVVAIMVALALWSTFTDTAPPRRRLDSRARARMRRRSRVIR